MRSLGSSLQEEILGLLLGRAPAVVQGEATVDVGEEHGLTALHFACLRGHSLLVARLCAEGAATNLKDDQGRTPMFCASFAGHLDCIDTLIEAKVRGHCRVGRLNI